ncbi:hypothetical protein FB45DRAFT_757303 [Roridomyces roridus]|uniref:Uncharacterized protein n=1 Tax=Roridomyces roridus TaxID=1738132 RepID=A0AAD7FCN2_9AGAR|nr:hypothetical protein FB45DRAFT_757303 [Roridomyces roridus]
MATPHFKRILLVTARHSRPLTQLRPAHRRSPSLIPPPLLLLWPGGHLLPTPPLPLHALPNLLPAHPGLLALHIRRGDFIQHCHHLIRWNARYLTWNNFGDPTIRSEHPDLPTLPDYLSIPDGVSHEDAVWAHCWQTTEEIVQRVRAVRLQSASGEHFPAQHLRRVYIATNGEREWVDGLTELLKADGWDSVWTSLDMQLTMEEVAVDEAVDMSALAAAETFIGEGFSSFTSNVVQFRLAGGRHPGTNRLW